MAGDEGGEPYWMGYEMGASAKKEAKRLQNAIVKHRTETLLLYGDDYEGNEIDSDLWRFVVDD